jgi:hypothetical protein
VKLVKNSFSLNHLNLSSCFPNTQIRCGLTQYNKNLENYLKQAAIDEDNNIKRKPFRPWCELTYLFIAVSHAKTLQVVHFSGNMLSKWSLDQIKEVLRVKPLNGYETTLEGRWDNDNVDIDEI